MFPFFCKLVRLPSFQTPTASSLKPLFFSTPLTCVPSRLGRLIMPATAIDMGHNGDHNASVAPLFALSYLGTSPLTCVQCLPSAGPLDIDSHTSIAPFGQAVFWGHTPQSYRIGLIITRLCELMGLVGLQNQQGLYDTACESRGIVVTAPHFKGLGTLEVHVVVGNVKLDSSSRWPRAYTYLRSI